METNSIKCPSCGSKIDVNKVLYSQLKEKVTEEYKAKNLDDKKFIEQQREAIKQEKQRLKEEKEKFEDSINTQVQEHIKSERSKIEEKVRKQVISESSEQIAAMQKELNEKSNRLNELNKVKADIERIKREKEELEEEITLKKEKELSERLKSEKAKITRYAEEENKFKILEKEKIISDLKDQLESAKRKAEQGSVQLQGEVQELEVERLLKTLYPTDKITEVRKGQRGADVLQEIIIDGINCGKIYYESKRTKNFDFKWIKKLKEDNLEMKADVLVLVTEALPENVEKYVFRDNIWICTFFELQALSMVLRKGIHDIHCVKLTQNGRESKMELLYNYLTGMEFKGQLEAIISGFSDLQKGYFDEKNRMHKLWAERQKQLDKVLLNAVNFYGSLKGIAGASIPEIKLLEEAEENLLI